MKDVEIEGKRKIVRRKNALNDTFNEYLTLGRSPMIEECDTPPIKQGGVGRQQEDK